MKHNNKHGKNDKSNFFVFLNFFFDNIIKKMGKSSKPIPTETSSSNDLLNDKEQLKNIAINEDTTIKTETPNTNRADEPTNEDLKFYIWQSISKETDAINENTIEEKQIREASQANAKASKEADIIHNDNFEIIGQSGNTKHKENVNVKKNTKSKNKKNQEKSAATGEDNQPLWKKNPEKYRKKRPLIIRMMGGLSAFIFFWILTAGIIGVFVVGAAATIIYSFSDPELDARFANLELDYTSIIYVKSLTNSADIEYEELYNDQNRVWVSLEDMPKSLLNATVAIEDKRFYEHMGVDPIRTLYATMMYTVNKVTGKSTEDVPGGSTLTQQLIKTITQNKDNSPVRKIIEMLQALYIERKYNKEQILEYYLNTVHFGNNCDGIYTAAKYYFNKEVSVLTATEAAAIISITKSPKYKEPYANPDANKERRTQVLYEMKSQGYITQEEYDKYKVEELKLRDRSKAASDSAIMSWYTDMVFSVVVDDLVKTYGYTREYATDYLYTGGLRIYTPMIIEYQRILDDYFTDESNYLEVLEGEAKQQVAMELLDPKTGNVLAVIGGRGEKDSARLLNRVTQTKRQPGSAIKPITIYGYAIENNIITAGTAIDDSPVKIEPSPIKQTIGLTYNKDPFTGKDITSSYKPWPTNYDGNYNGLIDVKTALSYSYNTPAAKILQMIGIEKSFDFAKNMLGLKSLVKSTDTGLTDMGLAPLSLGALTYGVTLQEITSAYTVYANNGTYSSPRCYTRVETYDGRIILENYSDSEIVFTPQTSYIITDILMRAVSVGSSKVANLNPIATAGKSGTTSNFNDRLFIGYTPYFLAGIWWGYDIAQKNDNTHHVKMWRDVMLKIHEATGITEATFVKPDGLVTATYCSVSGKIPGPWCDLDPVGNTVKLGIFKAGTQPTEVCDIHHALWVCDESGQIAHDNCPGAHQAVFRDIERSYPYAYIKVKDAQYICPPLKPSQILYNDPVLPVYSNMLPEGEYPTLPNSSKKRYANTLCRTHTPSATPHPYDPNKVIIPPDDTVPILPPSPLLDPATVAKLYGAKEEET